MERREEHEVTGPSEDCCMEHHYYAEGHSLSDSREDTEDIAKPW